MPLQLSNCQTQWRRMSIILHCEVIGMHLENQASIIGDLAQSIPVALCLAREQHLALRHRQLSLCRESSSHGKVVVPSTKTFHFTSRLGRISILAAPYRVRDFLLQNCVVNLGLLQGRKTQRTRGQPSLALNFLISSSQLVLVKYLR